MLDTMFKTIFESTSAITVWDFLVCLGVALITGAFLGFAYAFRNHVTKSFIVTLILLPAAVSMVIMLVNGNLGAGVAVAGAFSLIRFRSSPGTAREILVVFLSMCVGLAIGMGYIGYAVLFDMIMGIILLVINLVVLGAGRTLREKTLRITIPENLDYTDVFDDLFKKYTTRHETVSVKTTNMGSMFKLTYHITLKDLSREKQFIDELRCRNGNLEIAILNREEYFNDQL
jgi:hypothetical protein